MKIYEWNIGMAAAIPSDKQYLLNKWVIDEVVSEKPDCIVLTEFVLAKGIDYYLSKLENKGYHWFISSTTKENGILIALNKECFSFENTFDYYNIDSVRTANQVLSELLRSDSDIPDFYEIRVKYDNKPLSIIGVRIKVLLSNKEISYEQNKYKQNQFKFLDSYLPKLDHDVICIGDFNAYWAKCWNTQKNHTLPNTKNSFSLYTPQFNVGNWWSYVQKNDQKMTKKVQLDHLITNIKNKNIDVKYDWGYLSRYRIGIQPEEYKPPCGLPDHAILKVEIT